MAEYMICSTPRGTGMYIAQTIPRDYKCIEYIGTMQKDYFGKITATCPRLFQTEEAAKQYRNRFCDERKLPLWYVREYNACCNDVLPAKECEFA